MIEILKPEDCCGCTACMAVCPQKCIEMHCDPDGFTYPHVDIERCVQCGKCNKVCPVLNPYSSGAISAGVYAAINRDEQVRAESSSGGVFSVLAVAVLLRGGVVFGARFDDRFGVVHDFVEKLEELHVLRGSKYTQSLMGECFRRAAGFLAAGREVLFSGTPCQISGLRHFLGKDYDGLIAVDVACHGVPSPYVFERFLSEQKASVDARNGGKFTLTKFTFRNKSAGWKHYNVVGEYHTTETEPDSVIVSEPFFKNSFMRGFLHDLYLRPVCYACPTKRFSSGSDITIADYWGVEKHTPQMDDDRGTSLVVALTPKGKALLTQVASELILVPSTMVNAIAGNRALIESPVLPHQRGRFYADIKRMTVSQAVAKQTKTTMSKRIKRIIVKIINRLAKTIHR